MGESMGETGAYTEEAERLVRAHYADVLRYCRAHAPLGLAEDAAQETFLRFVRARMRYREQGRARAYLITIARNVCVDLQRDRALAWDPLPESLASGDEPVDDCAYDLASALARLPRSQREALELRYGQGLRLGEVARALGMSRFAARRAISAGLEALRIGLGPTQNGERGAS